MCVYDCLFCVMYAAYEKTSVALQQQQLLFNGKEVRNSEKLSALGVKDDDLLMMVSGAGAGAAASRYDLSIYVKLHCYEISWGPPI